VPKESRALASARTEGKRAAGSRWMARITISSSWRGSDGTWALGRSTGAVTMACISS
jgi:hypothetical protein